MERKITYYFKRKGKSVSEDHDAKPEETSSIYLDLGNDFRKGVIDHHHERDKKSGDLARSTAAQLWKCITDSGEIKKYISYLDNKKSITIITHSDPDLDSMASSFILCKYLDICHDKKKYDEFIREEKIKKLVDYVNRIDSGKGKSLKNGKGDPTIYALICLLKDVIKESGIIEDADDNKISNEMILTGNSLISAWYEKGTIDPEDPNTFCVGWNIVEETARNFGKALKVNFDVDRQKYDSEKPGVEFRYIRLFDKEKNENVTKKAAIWHKLPRSEFSYLYAREEGAEVTLVPTEEEHDGTTIIVYRISVSNENGDNDGISLAPMVEALEILEQVAEHNEYKRSGRFVRDHSGPRKGLAFYPFFETVDPWFLTPDNQMISNPKSGTLLTPEQIRSVFACGGLFVRNFYACSYSDDALSCGLKEKSINIDAKCDPTISSYKDAIHNFGNDEYGLCVMETDTLIISHGNSILDIICMSLAGDSYTMYRDEMFFHPDYRTSVYVSGRKAVVVYATGNNENHNNRLLNLCGNDRNDTEKAFNTIKTAMSDCYRKLAEFDLKLRSLAENMSSYKEDADLSGDAVGELSRITAEMCNEESIMDKEPVLGEIWDHFKKNLMTDSLKKDVTSTLRLISSYNSEKATEGIKKFSDIIVPFVLLFTAIQAGIIKVESINGSEHPVRAVVAWIVIIAVGAIMWIVIRNWDCIKKGWANIKERVKKGPQEGDNADGAKESR